MAIDLKKIFTPFPILHTSRLILRPLHEDDLDDLFAYASDPEIDHFTPWTHYRSIDEAQANLDEYLADYEIYGMGVWGIEHRDDQRLVGIANFSRPHPTNRRVEMGYTIARHYWGQGLATEAVQALLRFGFHEMDLLRIEAVVLPDHHASARVLQKAGFQLEGLLRCYQVWRGQPRDLQMYATVQHNYASQEF